MKHSTQARATHTRGAIVLPLVLASAALTVAAVSPTTALAATSAPQLTNLLGTPGTTATVGKAYSFQPTVPTQYKSYRITYYASGLPSWLKLTSTTGLLAGTPTSANVGTTSAITIYATNYSQTAYIAPFRITVSGSTTSSSGSSTTAPTISGSPATSVTVGNAYNFMPSATVPSGMNKTFAIANKPNWAAFSASTGQLSGTPSAAGTFSGIGISVNDGSATAALPSFAITVNSPPSSGGSSGSVTGSTGGSGSTTTTTPPIVTNGAPEVLYTDLASGPNSGGENNQGVYLSIFGKNFGSSGLGSTVKVYINNVEVNNYRSLGVSKGRPDIQQITVQIGALGNPTMGVPLPVKVVVNGAASNTNVNFIVNPGNFYFVDNVSGNDSTGVANDITHPFRHVQTSDYTQAVWGKVTAGDVIVMRGHGASPAWSDLGFENYFLRFRNKSGTVPKGQVGTGPITVLGYPGEDVYIDTEKSKGFSGGISGINGSNYPGLGQGGAIANLRIEGGGDDGAIDFEILGNNWRIVNNELTAATAQTTARAGGITGNGSGIVIYGNHVHNVHGDGQTNHGIYIDNDGSYDVGYNLIENIQGGNGFQMYTYGYTSGTQYTQNVNLHHNTIHDVNKHGINIADGTKAGIVVYDNVVYNTMDAGINFNTNTLQGAKIYNNTIYNTDRTGNSSYGAIMNQWNLPAGALDFENNIIQPSPGMPYGASSISGAGTITNNLWYGASDSTAVDSHAVTGSPAFVAPGSDFHLQSSSAAIGKGSLSVLSVVTTDYDLLKAISPSASSVDIGAYQH